MNIISVLLIRFVIFPALQNINVVAVNNSLRRRYTVYVDKRSEDCYFIKDVEYALSVSFVVIYKLRRVISCHNLNENSIKLDIPKLVFFVWNIFFRWWIRTLQGGNWMSGSLLKIQQGSLHIRLNLQAEGHTADSQTKIAQWILYQEIIKYALATGRHISTFNTLIINL